ncbi:SlyX family protein [Lignipirellula cremea]|uniref:Protein SlyX n=1 Tax=Lignipirellula cremea TaxID=2528010 RepID=A0A518E0J5_9BACT|nr:SlyX family protein [Lignipirellula cremea]QDU97605.1 hypothetical protein Pla8534_54550 [Lignipirellula cremea]
MPEPNPLQDRVTKLEESTAHQEHLVEQLNQIVIQLRVDLERLESENREHRRQVKWLTENNTTSQEIVDEKPPHY